MLFRAAAWATSAFGIGTKPGACRRSGKGVSTASSSGSFTLSRRHWQKWPQFKCL